MLNIQKYIKFSIFILLYWSLTVVYAQCEVDHSIEAVMGDGKLIKLENNTIWEVSDSDTSTSIFWQPTASIAICDDNLIITTQ